MTLEEAVEQQIALGQKDPLTIVAKITDLYGVEWLHEQAAFLAPDIAAEVARRSLSKQRRKFEIALKPGDEITKTEMKTAGMYIPSSEGFTIWKRVGDLTADDLRARAAFHEAFARGNIKRAVWCREVAEKMDAEGAKKLSQLKAELPELPSDDEIFELEPASL